MDLEIIRQEIDQIDTELTTLLEQRMQRVSQVATFKKYSGKSVLDQKREQEVLAKVADRVTNKEYEKTIVASFSDIMKHSRHYQTQRLSENK